jgi:hypothetical protein
VVLLVFSPPGFSIIHFYIFLICFACGILLATGMIGTHPDAVRFRRAAAGMPPRTKPLCSVSEQLFPFASSPAKGIFAASICFVIGLCLTGLGILIAFLFPSKGADRFLAGIPLWVCGLLCLWIAIRFPTRCIQVTPKAITLRGYFRTVTMPWESILALIHREHFILAFGGFVTTGVMYSLYSKHRKLSFSSQVPGSERLVSLISEGTGLAWNATPPAGIH